MVAQESLEPRFAHALAATLDALSTSRDEHPVQERLAAYYDTNGEYAGATFAMLGPITPDLLTVVDLHATTQLSVKVGPGATRRLLNDGPLHDAVMDALGAVPSDVAIDDDDPPYAQMAALHRAVKAAISARRTKNKNAWVTASKIGARKRPRLMPVRDREVCGLLGLLDLGDPLVDYQVFAYLLRHPQVREGLDGAMEATKAYGAGRDLTFDEAPLRLLDAALWTHATWN